MQIITPTMHQAAKPTGSTLKMDLGKSSHILAHGDHYREYNSDPMVLPTILSVLPVDLAA